MMKGAALAVVAGNCPWRAGSQIVHDAREIGCIMRAEVSDMTTVLRIDEFRAKCCDAARAQQ